MNLTERNGTDRMKRRKDNKLLYFPYGTKLIFKTVKAHFRYYVSNNINF